ncbi:MAG: hypothetical protein ACLFR8_10875 [Alkalispirochaeta sp.]
MSGKRDVPRKTDSREVELAINGTVVELNGYVMDVFQEVVVGLVRALGDENPDASITVSIGPKK